MLWVFAGAILVNPWNINDMAQAIEDALCMSEEERRERHRQNYMHVATHTAQVRMSMVLAPSHACLTTRMHQFGGIVCLQTCQVRFSRNDDNMHQ